MTRIVTDRFWGAQAASLFFSAACRKALMHTQTPLVPARCRRQAADDCRLAACVPQTLPRGAC